MAGTNQCSFAEEASFLSTKRNRFKLIPSIVTGPFIVRKAVGNKPALLGRKLDQRYFRGADYMETDVGEGELLLTFFYYNLSTLNYIQCPFHFSFLKNVIFFPPLFFSVFRL